MSLVVKAYKHDEDQELFIQFYKNGFGLRITLDNIYALEGEEFTEVSIDKPDGSGCYNPKWQDLFKGTRGYKMVNILRSISYASGWNYLLEQLDKFRQTGSRRDYPNLVVVYQLIENSLNDPAI